MKKWDIFYFHGDGYVSDGAVMASDEQDALWRCSVLHPGVSVYAKLAA